MFDMKFAKKTITKWCIETVAKLVFPEYTSELMLTFCHHLVQL